MRIALNFNSRMCLLTLVVCLTLFSPAYGYGQSETLKEYDVKAVFLYKILRYIEWPLESDLHSSPNITLCILGDDPFGESLEIIKGQSIQGRKLIVKHFVTSRKGLQCHVVFLSASVHDQVPQLSASFKRTHTLIMGDSLGYASRGVMVNFYLEQGKVRFESNIASVNDSGLKISSKLLKLARIIRIQQPERSE